MTSSDKPSRGTPLIVVVDQGIHGENSVGGGQAARMELVSRLRSRLQARFALVTCRARLAELGQPIYDKVVVVDYVHFAKRRNEIQRNPVWWVKASVLLLRSAVRFRRTLDELAADASVSEVIVFPNENYSRLMYVLARWLGRTRFRGLTVIDNDYSRYRIDGPMKLAYGGSFAKLIASSRAVAEAFLPHGRGRIEVIYPGVDLERLRTAAVAAHSELRVGRFAIALVGSLIDIKRPELAVEIVSRLIAEQGVQATLHVVGDGPLLDATRACATRRGMVDGEDVVFWGHVPLEKTYRLVAGCSVLLHVSTTESFARCVVEAQALGKPVVMARIPGAEEIVEDGVTGFLVERDNVDSFVNTLAALAGDGSLQMDLGDRARQFAKAFDLESTISAYSRAFYETFGVRVLEVPTSDP